MTSPGALPSGDPASHLTLLLRGVLPPLSSKYLELCDLDARKAVGEEPWAERHLDPSSGFGSALTEPLGVAESSATK